MTAGLTVFNTDNTVQIDESYRNYGFRSKIQISVTTSNIVGSGIPDVYPYSFTTPGTIAQLVACSSNSQYPYLLHSYFDGTSWTHNFRFIHDPGESGFYEPSTYTGTVTFYVFDVIDSSFSNVGLEVFNAASQRVFHSDMTLMKSGPVIYAGSNYTGASGRIYAPLVLEIGIFTPTPVPGQGYRQWQRCLRVQSGGQVIRSRELSPGVVGAAGPYDAGGLYAALDVTDYT